MDSVSFKKKSKKIKELGEKKKDGNIRRFERERMENGICQSIYKRQFK